MKISIVNRHISRGIGGSEAQCDLIATELTARGHQVHYVAIGGAAGSWRGSYEVHQVAMSGAEIGFKTSEIQPDVVYWRFNKRCFYRAARIIESSGAPIVFSVSHVADTEKWSSKMSLRGASAMDCLRILKSKLISRWNYRGFAFVRGVVVNNATHLNRIPVARQVHIHNSLAPESGEVGSGDAWPRPFCLWVANLKPQKQPERFVQLADNFSSSGVDFLMVGGLQSARYLYLQNKENWPPNFHYLGTRDTHYVNALLRACQFVVHTCLPEGFPNIFIQAWSHGKPVVSLSFDPEGILSRERIGRLSGNFEQFVLDVDDLIRDRDSRAQMGERARRLARSEFDLRINVLRLEEFLEEVIELRRTESSQHSD